MRRQLVGVVSGAESLELLVEQTMVTTVAVVVIVAVVVVAVVLVFVFVFAVVEAEVEVVHAVLTQVPFERLRLTKQL